VSRREKKFDPEATLKRQEKLAKELRKKKLALIPRLHPGFRSLKCAKCGKKWQLPRDAYASLTCNCGETVAG